MVAIIPQGSRTAALGEAAGLGISQALQSLAQQKASRMQQQNVMQQYEAMGLPPGLASLDPQIQKALIDQYGQQQRDAQRLALLSPQSQQALAQTLGEPETAEAFTDIMATPGGVAEEQIEAVQPTPRGPQRAQPRPEPYAEEQIAQLEALGYTQDAKARRRANEQVRKENLQREKLELGRFDKSFEFHKEDIRETNKAGTIAKENTIYVDEMQNLIDEGNLTGPRAAQLFDAAGWSLDILNNPSSDSFGKIRTRFFKGMSKIFGGKVAVVEFQEFVKGIPSLTQSLAGRQLIVNMMRIESQGDMMRQRVMNDVVGEYEEAGKPLPKNFDKLINERMEPLREPLIKEFHDTQAKVRALGHATSKQKKVLSQVTASGGIVETPEGQVWMATPNGSTKLVPQDKAMDAMRKSKYVFIQ